MLQLLLVLTLSALVCYSFTTARAAEKEVPAKERTREGARTAPAEQPKTTPREAGSPTRTGEGDGEGSRKTGARDGEKPRTGGERDGEASRKTGMRDGEKPRAGREGEKPRTGGERDGEGSRKTGIRDGEKPRTGGERDGEGGKKSSARDGDRTTSSGETITLKVIKNGEAVMVGVEEVSMNRLRGHLSTFLPDHPGAKVVVTGDENVPLGALHNTVDAVRDNGNKNVGIKAE